MKIAELALAQVAQNNGISVEDVDDAIRLLIQDAHPSFLNQITSTGIQPTPVELVQYITEMLLHGSNP